MKKLFIGIVVSCFIINAQAQNQEDLFRYSNQGLIGSARTLGLGGAWGAVGADPTSASINPAGLALYRKNEFMGSLAITATMSSANYQGNITKDGRTILNLPNLGMVFTKLNQSAGKDQTTGVVSSSFAFGMNRINNFQTTTSYSGNNNNQSIAQYFANKAAGTDSTILNSADYDNEPYAQAWRTFLIDNSGSPSAYKSIFEVLGDSVYTVNQGNVIQNKGSANEWYAGAGFNIGNFLYLGGSVVIQDIDFTSDNTYTESVVKSSINSTTPARYKSVTINQSLRTEGSGVGGKFGVILRPVDFLKMGVSYHTPIRIDLTDYYQNTMDMKYTTGSSNSADGREDYYKYQIVTPGRLIASGAITLRQIAILAVDYERVDFTQGRFSDQSTFAIANSNNKVIYDIANNYRFGVEIKADDIRIRAGYSILGSPYKENVVSKTDGTKQVISAGIGLIYNKAFFFDFAVSDRIGKDYITPYEGCNASAVNTTNQLNFIIGAGYRF